MSIRTHSNFDDIDQDSRLARVRKLMGKAAATTNPHEADAFAAKAAELAARYRIDPDSVAADARSGNGADRRRPELRELELGRGAYVRARLALLTAVADANDVRVLFTTGPAGMVAHLAGFPDDLDVVTVMYHSLHTQATSQLAGIRRSTPAATQRYRRSFLFGYADRIGALLEQSRLDAESAAEAASDAADGGRSTQPGGPSALMRRTRLAAVDEHVAERFPRVRSARPPGAAQVGGWTAGAAAADSADVGRRRLPGRPAIGPG